MFKIVIYLTTLTSILVLGDEEVPRKPLYKYRYETEDLMKTAASSVPIHGYHVVEGGYYPSEAGFSGGFGGGGISSGGFGGYGGQYIGGKLGPVGIGGGYGPGFIGGGGGAIGAGGIGGGQFIGGGIGSSKFIGGGIGGGQFIGGAGGGQFIGGGGAGLGGHGYGGEIIDKNVYSGEKKNLNDEQYEKASGKKGEEINHGQEGYSQGKVAVKDIKGDNGYYSDVEGGKKVIEDGKSYHGGQHFNQEGKNGGEKKNKQGHKKGHVIKGFKTSHHKDETGKTEEFYDEENDEGDNYNYNGQSGSFGENGASQFKGGHEDGKFNSGESKKEGHYDNEHIVDKSNADHGKYGENKYAGSGAVYGVNNGVDQQSLLGHQENSRFYKHHPHYVPFYHY